LALISKVKVFVVQSWKSLHTSKAAYFLSISLLKINGKLKTAYSHLVLEYYRYSWSISIICSSYYLKQFLYCII